jgi:hypothetical protein
MGVLAVACGGLILISLGMVAELIVSARPADELYVIAERAGWCAEGTEQQGGQR